MAPSSARLDVPGSFKAAEEVSCLQAGLWGLCHRDRVGAAARGALSTTLSGCSDGCPGAASWAVQGQLQHTELLSCTQLSKVMDFIPLLLWPQFGFREHRQAPSRPAAPHISK